MKEATIYDKEVLDTYNVSWNVLGIMKPNNSRIICL